MFSSVQYVRDLCRSRGIPVSQLERECGFSNGYLNPRKLSRLPYDRAQAIARYLGVSVNAILTGMGWGMLISSLAILVAFFLDTRIKNREDLARWEYPVLGTIPAFSEAQKMGTYGYGYGRKGGK